MRVCEERSDELRERVYGILVSKVDTFIRSVATLTSVVVSNIINTSSFPTRFAHCSLHQQIIFSMVLISSFCAMFIFATRVENSSYNGRTINARGELRARSDVCWPTNY